MESDTMRCNVSRVYPENVTRVDVQDGSQTYLGVVTDPHVIYQVGDPVHAIRLSDGQVLILGHVQPANGNDWMKDRSELIPLRPFRPQRVVADDLTPEAWTRVIARVKQELLDDLIKAFQQDDARS